LYNKSNKPLHRIVYEQTLRKLAIGELKVGDRLPREADYAVALGVSRHTLRQAFSHLEHVGVIKRRKRGGTEIIAHKPLHKFTLEQKGFTNPVAVMRETLFDITDVSIVGEDANVVLKNFQDDSANWLCCTGTRTKVGQTIPFFWSQVFVTEQFSDLGVKAGDSPSSIYELVKKQYGQSMARVRQSCSAMLCQPDVAQALGLEEGFPVLTHCAEVYNAQGEILTLAETQYDPLRFKLVVSLNLTDSP